jgi:hypothetical protein
LEKKLLLILLDAHFYRKSGHTLEAAVNMLKFVKLGLTNINLHSFYFMTFIEQAMILMMSSVPQKEGKKLYLPFEYLKYFNSIWNVTAEQKKCF